MVAEVKSESLYNISAHSVYTLYKGFSDIHDKYNHYNILYKITYCLYRGSDLTSTTATIKWPLANQMRLIYPINQSDVY